MNSTSHERRTELVEVSPVTNHEYLDILDQTGAPSGRTALRAEAHARGLWHRTAHVWVVTPDHRILLQKRAPEKESFPGLWDISAAGHIPAGDRSQDGAVREAREELGLTIGVDELKLLGTLPQCYDRPDGGFLDREFVDVYVVVKEVVVNDLVLQAEEVTDAALFSWSELRALMGDHPERFVPHEEEYHLLELFVEGMRG